jgi:hypothetical protein
MIFFQLCILCLDMPVQYQLLFNFLLQLLNLCYQFLFIQGLVWARCDCFLSHLFSGFFFLSHAPQSLCYQPLYFTYCSSTSTSFFLENSKYPWVLFEEKVYLELSPSWPCFWWSFIWEVRLLQVF